MKFSKVGLAVSCLVLFVVGFLISEMSHSRTVRPTGAVADFPKYYSSIAELYDDADLVVHVKASRAGDFFLYHNDLPSTVTTVTVQKVFKDLSNTSALEIKVLEEGGRKNGVSAGGLSPVLEEGKSYVLFLVKPLTDDVPENSYVILGSFMGKFEVTGAGRLVYLGPAGEVKALQDEVRGTPFADLPNWLKR